MNNLEGFELEDAIAARLGVYRSYSTDTSIRFPLAEGEEFELHELWTGKCVARVRQPLTGTDGEWMEGDTLALARCRAWLAWQERL